MTFVAINNHGADRSIPQVVPHHDVLTHESAEIQRYLGADERRRARLAERDELKKSFSRSVEHVNVPFDLKVLQRQQSWPNLAQDSPDNSNDKINSLEESKIVYYYHK
jgi:hypothetical protein